MKKRSLIIGIGSVLALACIAFAIYVFTFGTLFKSDRNCEKEWSLLKIDNFQIMSVNPDESWFSDIKKAYLVKKVEDGSLPVSLSVSFSNREKREYKDIKCKIVYEGVSFESVLTSFVRQENDTMSIYTGVFKYDLSDVKSVPSESLVSELAHFSPEKAKIYIMPETDSHHKESDWVALN